MRVDDILQDFLSEAEERFQALETHIVTLERRPQDAGARAEIFRALHSLKGACGFLGFRRLGDLAHLAEDVLPQIEGTSTDLPQGLATLLLATLDAMRGCVVEIAEHGTEMPGVPQEENILRQTLAAAATGAAIDVSGLETLAARDVAVRPILRVQSDVFDNLVALSGEIALMRDRLRAAGAMDTASAAQFAQLTQNLQAEVLRGRLQPVMEVWRGLPRLVRDLAGAAFLAVRLETEGNETLLDRQVLDTIRDPIAHLVRNCLSHGIEPPAARRAAGKPSEGVIRLAAAAAEGQVIITIADDGRGLDLDAIRARAMSGGIVAAADLAAMSPSQVAALVFTPHFSTAAQVGDMAGRGVGLDAAASALAAIGGSLSVLPPEAGKGACFVMRVPLTLAMMPVVVVASAGQRFALPRSMLIRFCRIGGAAGRAGEMPVFYQNGKHLPLLSLPIAAQGAADTDRGAFAAIVRSEGMTAALQIDEILWTGDVIVKPLPQMLQGCGIYLGLTLLADGVPAMIVDVRSLLARAGVETSMVLPAAAAPEAPLQRLLIFERSGLCALPLSAIDVVRRFSPDALHRAQDGTEYYTCDDRLLPVVASAAQEFSDHAGFVIVLRQGCGCLLCTDVKGFADVPASDTAAGSRMIDGRATEVIDLQQLSTGTADTSAPAGSILLIDDSPFFCSLLTPMLEQAGYQVEIAADVASALRLRAAGARFDLIISDIEMPDMDGLSFARAVRAEGSLWRTIPLLAISAHATRHDENRGRAAGFDAFITKFDRAKLLGTLSHLRRRA